MQRSLVGEHPSANNVTDIKVVSNNSAHVSTTQLAATETRSKVISQPSPVPAARTPTLEAPSSLGSPSTYSESWRGSSSHVRSEEAWISNSGDGEQQTLGTQFTGAHSVTEAIPSFFSMSSPASVSPTLPAAEHPHLHSHDSEIHPFTTAASQPSNPPILPLVQQIPTHTPSSPQWTGESIYRTIMNRLTTLEANHTLYARYVEEQTASVRDVLRKLNEEVGRLESIVGASTFGDQSVR